MKNLILNSIIPRFIRAFVAGGVGAMAMIQFTGTNVFADLRTFVGVLIIAFIVGGITGTLQAADKWIRATWGSDA